VPFSLHLDELACMLNAELADHPVYDGVELQWFDDAVHGTGMLAFLSRRADRRVDYYQQRGLRLDRSGYAIGGGTGSWTEIDFAVARLVVGEEGVDAEARFADVDGRLIEIRVDDRDGRPRQRGGLLAPVSAAIERPTSLLLVWLPHFDLVRVAGRPPMVRIDGEEVSTGRLPGRRLHRRHLIKYAAPVVTILVNPTHDGAQPAGRRTADPWWSGRRRGRAVRRARRPSRAAALRSGGPRPRWARRRRRRGRALARRGRRGPADGGQLVSSTCRRPGDRGPGGR